jgi:hypothetical protein
MTSAGSGSLVVPDAQSSWDDVVPGTGTLVLATDVTTGGEPPYPDLRMLPTRIMPFEPIVYGDVSSVIVTSVR